jgi:calcineurin-like phosphoesterase
MMLNGVLLTLDDNSGKALSIERLSMTSAE